MYYPPPGPPAKKGVSPIVWVLVGVAAFLMLVVISVVGAGFFLVHKAKQAGFDSDLMKRNPAYAAIKMAAALNPDIEVVSMDDDKETVTVRDKKSGKTYSVNLDDAKRGRFVIQQDGKDAVTVQANGDGKDGSLVVKSDDGTVKMGAGAKVPTWVPEYPGSDPQGVYSAQGKDGQSSMFTFKTKDSPDQVLRFFEDAFKSAGMKTSVVNGHSDKESGGVVTAEGNEKTAVVSVGSSGGETTVSVTATAKK
jgi:hypothetical protein